MDGTTWLMIGIGAAIAILLIIIVASGYVKAPPDKAYIITGLRKKRVIGKAAIRIPFLERLDKLDLAAMQVDVKTSSPVPTADYININVDAVVNIKIPTVDMTVPIGDGATTVYTADESLAKAQQNFLNKDSTYIVRVAKEVLEGNIREIIGQMRLEEMISDRQRFAELVKQNAAPDLAELGLTIVSFNVQNFKDDNGIINDMGIDNTMQIKKKAAISKAEAERDIKIAQAEANKRANDARIDSETAIAERENELAIKKAELKREADIKQAEADAAYTIQQEEQRKTIEITTAAANLAKQEKEVEIKAKEAEIKERALEAEVKKTAEAQKYAEQQRADAELYTAQKQAEAKLATETRQAEAELVKAQKAAEAEKARAEAARYAAEQEAEGIRAKGVAEAEAIKAAALAEAEGLDKKAEAMRKMEEAAVLQMYFDKLPDVAKAIAEPLARTEKIVMYGEGNGSKLVGDVTKSISQVNEGLLEGTGMSLSGMFQSIVSGRAAGNAIGEKLAESNSESKASGGDKSPIILSDSE
ncbi:flotillin family protein [bacterium]|nr:flotillin family protein [bacterium]